MKKIFFCFSFLAIVNSLRSQSCGGPPLLSENFNNGIPNTWTVLNYDTNALFFNMPLKGYTGAWQAYSHFARKCAANTSRYSGSGSSGSYANDYLITPALTLGTGPFCLSWKASTQYSNYVENYEIRISTTTPDSTGMLANPALAIINTDLPEWTEHTIDLSAYAGQTVYIGFWYNANDQYAIFIDDITISHPVTNDGSVATVDLNDIVAPSPQIISGTFLNAGVNATTSMTLNWNVNNGAVNSMPVTSVNISPSSFYTYSHSVNWNVSTNGTYSLNIWASNINGGADNYTGNDTLTKLVFVNNFQRKVLMEEFTQASCPPCASQNPQYNATLYNSRAAGEITSIQYHTIWPGVDPMNAFNKSDVDTRVEYYGIAGVPSAMIDGMFIPDSCSFYVGAPACLTQFMIDDAYAVPSIFDIKLNSTKNGNNVDVKVIVTAKTDIPITSFKLYTAIVEDTVVYANPPGTNGEMEFYQVMRTMLPDSSGQVLTAMANNQLLTFNYSYPIDPNYVESELRAVAFIQDEATKKVYQSEMTSTTYTGIHALLADLEIGVFPNPAKDFIILSSKNTDGKKLQWKIFNALSQQVLSEKEKINGKNFKEEIDIHSLAPGVYYLEITIDGEKIVKKISKL